MDRIEILETASKLTGGDRNVSYGSPVENMEHIAALWGAYFDNQLSFSGEDVAQMMVLVKMARSKGAALTLDNYIDGSAYMAIAGECAVAERSNNE